MALVCDYNSVPRDKGNGESMQIMSAGCWFVLRKSGVTQVRITCSDWRIYYNIPQYIHPPITPINTHPSMHAPFVHACIHPFH